MQSPKVSVSLITYNHAPFIEQAIEGVLQQKTNFPIELVIGEDESSDGTREIVQRYAAAHPELIRVHFHSRSSNISYQGRATGRFNYVNNLRSTRGEYVALLDGDDYWIDPGKLQQQVDFLDSHPSCGTCFHRVSVVNAAGKELRQSPVVGPDQSTYTVSDLLRRRFFTNAPSVMFRRGLFDDFPEWYFRVPVGDFALHVLNGMKSDFGFLNRVMSAYRVHGGGIWSLSTTDEGHANHQSIADQRRLRQMLGAVDLYEILKEELAPNFDDEFREGIAFYAHEAAHILRRSKDWPALRDIMPKVWKCRPFPREVPLASVLALSMQGYLPFTAALADRVRQFGKK